jgi:hypothetical protein
VIEHFFDAVVLNGQSAWIRHGRLPSERRRYDERTKEFRDRRTSIVETRVLHGLYVAGLSHTLFSTIRAAKGAVNWTAG